MHLLGWKGWRGLQREAKGVGEVHVHLSCSQSACALMKPFPIKVFKFLPSCDGLRMLPKAIGQNSSQAGWNPAIRGPKSKGHSRNINVEVNFTIPPCRHPNSCPCTQPLMSSSWRQASAIPLMPLFSCSACHYNSEGIANSIEDTNR